MSYETIRLRHEGPCSFLQIHRPAENNAINQALVDECNDAIDRLPSATTILVIEGLPHAFCTGADFGEICRLTDSVRWDAAGESPGANPDDLYALWHRLATGPVCTVANVRGKVNAGGVGFVAACDIALADATVELSLSELLFGLFPACVMPFLMRRIGVQRAHYLTLTTKPISAQRGKEWGLLDDVGSSDELVRLHLLRLRRLTKDAITTYKAYMNSIHPDLAQVKPTAVAATRAMFSAPQNLANIQKFVSTGRFPWD